MFFYLILFLKQKISLSGQLLFLFKIILQIFFIILFIIYEFHGRIWLDYKTVIVISLPWTHNGSSVYIIIYTFKEKNYNK